MSKEISSQNGRLTTNKREIKDFPKLWWATSFIHKTVGDISPFTRRKRKFIKAERGGCNDKAKTWKNQRG